MTTLPDIQLGLLSAKTEKYVGVEGNDIAGYVVKVGEGVTEYVAPLTKSRPWLRSVAPASLTSSIPNSVSFENASTVLLVYTQYGS
ncbi:hypothetical protein BC835DRAFT_1413603 [Cytidiella melzeri]|nr:hypothetical protein BC835DRAFT_1413603 [Cytidiella melzeri]